MSSRRQWEDEENGAYPSYPTTHTSARQEYSQGGYDQSEPYYTDSNDNDIGENYGNDPKDERYGNGYTSQDPQETELPQHEGAIAHRSRMHRWFRKLFDHGVEARGIERVPEDERDGRHTIGLLLLWWSVNSVVSTVPIGLLAQAYFTLSFKSAIAAIVSFTAIGAACCGFIATLGPKTGMRTMVISRYSVGFVGGTIFSLLNILTQLGFSCTAVILGGQTLNNVSNDKLPLEAAIVLVGFIALILCFVGYNAVHYWERYAWIVLIIFYFCMWGLGGSKGFDIHAQEAKEDTGLAFAGGFLSFGGIVFSSSAGWAPICADFCCRLPHKISAIKVFFLTWFGLMVPLVFLESLSAALMTVPEYAAAFEEGDAGGVIAKVFEPWGGGGKFILVILSFSIICNCTPNTYSAALSAQTLLPWFEKIPRAVWCVVMFVIYTVAAVAGREHFSEILSNFLAILGYWIAFFIVVVAEEHFIFRSWIIYDGYDLDAYDDIRELPVGIAGIFACCCGAGLAVVGMAQVWYIGPVGALFGEAGGDLGFELSAAATAIVYPPLRYLEYKYFER